MSMSKTPSCEAQLSLNFEVKIEAAIRREALNVVDQLRPAVGGAVVVQFVDMATRRARADAIRRVRSEGIFVSDSY